MVAIRFRFSVSVVNRLRAAKPSIFKRDGSISESKLPTVIIVATEYPLREEVESTWQPYEMEARLDVGGSEYTLYASIIRHHHLAGHAFACVHSPKLKYGQ